MRDQIFEHLKRLDQLPRGASYEKARAEWMVKALELLLLDALTRHPTE